MVVPRRPPESLEAAYLRAYKLRYEDRLLYPEILAELAKEYPQCGSKTTAIRWVAKGYRLVHYDEDGMTDPMRKRGARREMTGDTLDSLFAKIETEMDKGHLKREVGRQLQLRALENYIHLHGLRRPPQPARFKVSGAGRAVVSDDLRGALGAIPRDELDALIERMLPDERND